MKYSPRNLSQNAFTIVELLVVVVVIGILASITIVSYNGAQERARRTAAIDGINQAVDLLEAFQVKNGGLYPASGSLASAGVKDSDSVTYQYTQTDSGKNYCITATNKNVSYMMTQDAKPLAKACPGHNQNGVAAITNLATNPSFESNVTGYTGAASTITQDNTWSQNGSYSMKSVPSSTTSNDSFSTIGGDLGGFRAGLQAGKTYTISATIRLTAPLTGTLGGNASRQMTAWYTSSTGSHSITRGNQAPNAAGITRTSVTYTIPANATGAWIRMYNGASSGNGTVWWDSVMITEGSTLYNYADGSSTNWVWNGIPANNVTSSGIPL